MAGKDDYKHQDIYKKATNLMSAEEYMKFEDAYEDAGVDALSTMKGKKAKDYTSGVGLLTDALIKFRKSAKHPDASDKKEHRFMYFNKVEQFLEAYKRQAQTDDEGIERLLKTASGRRRLMQALMDNEKNTIYSQDLDYRIKNLIPAHDETLKKIAEYHLEQNPHLKKEYSGAKKAKLKTSRDDLMDELKSHYQKNLETMLRDYQPKDKKK